MQLVEEEMELKVANTIAYANSQSIDPKADGDAGGAGGAMLVERTIRDGGSKEAGHAQMGAISDDD